MSEYEVTKISKKFLRRLGICVELRAANSIRTSSLPIFIARNCFVTQSMSQSAMTLNVKGIARQLGKAWKLGIEDLSS